MINPPYIKLFIRDFSFDVQDMSDKELGKYIRSFILAYKTGEIKEENEQDSLFFSLKKARETYSERCKINRENRTKSNTCNNESSTNGKRMVDDPVNILTTNQEHTNQEHTNNKIVYANDDDVHLAKQDKSSNRDCSLEKEKEEKNNAVKEEKETDGFNEAWERFPKQRKGGRDNALKAWRKATTRSTSEKIINGIVKYSESEEVSNGYAKGMAAWLNDDRWESDYTSAKKQHTNVRTV